MRLFEVPAGRRIRARSNSIRLVLLDDLELPVARDVTWEGSVTDRYFEFKTGLVRRLVVDLSVDFWKGYGIWLRDVEVEVLHDADMGSNSPDRHGATGGGGDRLPPDWPQGETAETPDSS